MMKTLYYDISSPDGLTIEQVESIRNAAVQLVGKNMHPRYQMAVDDLFKASNALANEMNMDELRSSGTTDNAKL